MLYCDLDMNRSRLDRVRSKRAGKEGLVYLLIAVVLIIIMLIWGLPALARLVGYFTKSDTDSTPTTNELRPAPPIFSDIPEATYSAKVKISGFAQPGLDIVLYVNATEVDRKLISESGDFTFDNVSLTEGDNSVYAYSQTPHDLRSEQSRTYTVSLDTTKPVVTIDSPHDGDVSHGQSGQTVTFTGSVNEPGSKVFIGERMAIVSDGKFSLPYQLASGDQEIPIRAVDRAGNENVSSIKLRWEP